MSAALAAVPVSEWSKPDVESTSMCAFMPKCHSLPFLSWCISGARSLPLFFVEEGAAIIVASTIVPSYHQKLLLAEQCRHLCKDLRGEGVRFEQMTEVEQGGGIGHGLHAQTNPGESAHRLAVIDRVFERLIRQRIPRLEKE